MEGVASLFPLFILESDGTLTGGMSPFLAEAPGGDTLLDVHPTQLQVICKGRIPPTRLI